MVPTRNRYGADWLLAQKEVQASDRLVINMASGGGWVAKFKRR